MRTIIFSISLLFVFTGMLGCKTHDSRSSGTRSIPSSNLSATSGIASKPAEPEPLRVDGEIVELSPSPDFSALALKVHSREKGQDRYAVMIYDPNTARFTAERSFKYPSDIQAWSPDSRMLAIIEDYRNIILMSPTGFINTIITNSNEVHSLAWDGKGDDIYYIDVDNRGLCRYNFITRRLASRKISYNCNLFRSNSRACIAEYHEKVVIVYRVEPRKYLLTVPISAVENKWYFDPTHFDLSPDGCNYHLAERYSGSAQDTVAKVEDAWKVKKNMLAAICVDIFIEETNLTFLRWSPFPNHHEAISKNVVVDLEYGAYSSLPRTPFLPSDRYITWWQRPGQYLVITERGVEMRGRTENGILIGIQDDKDRPVLIHHTLVTYQ